MGKGSHGSFATPVGKSAPSHDAVDQDGSPTQAKATFMKASGPGAPPVKSPMEGFHSGPKGSAKSGDSEPQEGDGSGQAGGPPVKQPPGKGAHAGDEGGVHVGVGAMPLSQKAPPGSPVPPGKGFKGSQDLLGCQKGKGARPPLSRPEDALAATPGTISSTGMPGTAWSTPGTFGKGAKGAVDALERSKGAGKSEEDMRSKGVGKSLKSLTSPPSEGLKGCGKGIPQGLAEARPKSALPPRQSGKMQAAPGQTPAAAPALTRHPSDDTWGEWGNDGKWSSESTAPAAAKTSKGEGDFFGNDAKGSWQSEAKGCGGRWSLDGIGAGSGALKDDGGFSGDAKSSWSSDAKGGTAGSKSWADGAASQVGGSSGKGGASGSSSWPTSGSFPDGWTSPGGKGAGADKEQDNSARDDRSAGASQDGGERRAPEPSGCERVPPGGRAESEPPPWSRRAPPGKGQLAPSTPPGDSKGFGKGTPGAVGKSASVAGAPSSTDSFGAAKGSSAGESTASWAPTVPKGGMCEAHGNACGSNLAVGAVAKGGKPSSPPPPTVSAKGPQIQQTPFRSVSGTAPGRTLPKPLLPKPCPSGQSFRGW